MALCLYIYLLVLWIQTVLTENDCSVDKQQRKKVIFDTDFGVDVDDTLALLLLLSKWTEIELVAIHTLGPGKHTLVASRMVKKYATLMGFGDIPVYVGANTTFTESTEYPPYWNHIGKGVVNEQEHAYWDEYLIFDAPPVNLYNSVDFVIAVGPLSNLANLFSLHSAYHIKHLVLMGGSLMYDMDDSYPLDHKALQKDFNFRIDPDAVIEVLSSVERVEQITMVTGNITLQCWMNYHDLMNLKRVSKYQYPFMQLMVDQIEIWSQIQKAIFFDPVADDNVAFLHDPLSLSFVFGEPVWSQFLTMEQMEIAFAKNEHNVLHTLMSSELAEKWTEEQTRKIVFKRNITVSMKQSCADFRRFYFETVVNFVYPQLSPGSVCV